MKLTTVGDILRATCHRCEHRKRINGWTVLCKDGGNVIAHQKSGFCPMGKFPADLPDNLDPATAWQLDSKGNEGCGC